ncbi:MAG: hypothetical protein ACKVOW_03265 [Chitinophagaceae bacterium]
MLRSILKLYVWVTSIFIIVFVLIFSISLRLGWNIYDWFYKNHSNWVNPIATTKESIDDILTINFFILLVVSIYLLKKSERIGRLGLMASLFFLYHFWFWLNFV